MGLKTPNYDVDVSTDGQIDGVWNWNKTGNGTSDYRGTNAGYWQSLYHSNGGCRIHVRTEEYTSKTCGRCGSIHAAKMHSRTLNCFRCGYVVNRDVNGARNIFLKNIALLTEPERALPR